MRKLPIRSAGRDDLAFDPDAYIDSRAEQYADWYDKKAVSAKRAFLRSRIVIAIGAIATPFLATQDWNVTAGTLSFDVCNLLGALIGLAVAGLVALEGILKYQDQWKNYRTTEQYLRTKIVMFCNGVGEYDSPSPDKSFKMFVTNVETAIKNENKVTLSVLTRVSGVEQISTTATDKAL